jgi:hypothetical protein
VKTQEVSRLINCLTNDEDSRQDLWVHYLSGNSSESFVVHLEEISQECSQDDKIKANLWDLFKNPPSDRFYTMLGNFSQFEQSVICLLMLGLTLSEISGYKGLSEIRIRQVVYSIKSNKCWETLYGIKDDA